MRRLLHLLLLLLMHRLRAVHLRNVLLLLLHLLVSEVRRERLHRLVRRGVVASGIRSIRVYRRFVLL